MQPSATHVHAPPLHAAPARLVQDSLGLLAERLEPVARPVMEPDGWTGMDGVEFDLSRYEVAHPVVEALVGIHVRADALDLELHTIIASSVPTSPVPHLTIEGVQVGPSLFLSLDLVPQVDLIADVEHTEVVYEPLSERFEAFYATAGVTVAQLRARHRLLLSPWLLSAALGPDALEPAAAQVLHWTEHWLDLLDRPLPSVDAETTAARDVDVRRRLYSNRATKNQDLLDRMVGTDRGQLVRDVLINPWV